MGENVLRGPKREEMTVIFEEYSIGRIIFYALTEMPDRELFVDATNKKSISSKDILRKSIILAKKLRKLGVRKNDVISTINENDLNFCVIFAASAYIGSILHPINPAYTTWELKHALNLTKPKIIFASEKLESDLIALQKELHYIEEIITVGDAKEEGISFDDIIINGSKSFDEGFQIEDVDVEEQVLVILCSSGTTGYPKGVMLTHKNFIYALAYLGDPIFISNSDKEISVSFAPFFHLFGFALVLSSLVLGMKLIIFSKFNPRSYLKAIEEYQSTKLWVVPPVALFLAKSALVDDYNLSCVKDIFCGSAPLGYKLQKILEERLKVIVRQGYGLTETTGCICMTPMGTRVKQSTVGKLVYGLNCKILDITSRQKVGPNVLGEICVKSELNMKGYVNNPDATQQSFDEEGYLYTGDVGYYDDEGFFHVVDRIKELIKYKCFQVPPAELEDILKSHEEIRDVAVVGLPDERCGELPLAFVVKENGSNITENEIIKFVAAHVSVQKQLHGGVRFIDEIPKTPSGKILRRTLKELLKVDEKDV